MAGMRQLGLLTDLYEITMAYGYWKARLHDREAIFTLTFRRNPFEGGFSIACGLEQVIRFLREFRFEKSDTDYLADLRGNNGAPLFDRAFLKHLREVRFSCDLDAVPEGTAVFPNEPLLRVQGPVMEAQIIETALLNMLNFQSLIATKAARVCMAARGIPVVEFGLRRAQGIDGGLTASRAAFIGGCAGTSNLLAGKLHGIPVSGTQAHSWVMFFGSEREAFQTYAKALPNNCVFLADTYDTLTGVKQAMRVGRQLRKQGHEMAGVRLDSGDITALSIAARKLLDEAGFPDARIVASGDLDEYAISALSRKGAKVDVWGVGTRLATGEGGPSMNGVYKLSGVRDPDGRWIYKMKLSEEAVKSTIPGLQQVRRFSGRDGLFAGDVIYDVKQGLSRNGAAGTDLLAPIFRRGRLVYDVPGIGQVREFARAQLASLAPAIKRLRNADTYPVRIDEKLHALKSKLAKAARKQRL